jgi:hypothetical protein
VEQVLRNLPARDYLAVWLVLARGPIGEDSIKDIPEVRIVRRGNFVGVAAERQWDAIRASKQLKVTWEAVDKAGGSSGHSREPLEANVTATQRDPPLS